MRPCLYPPPGLRLSLGTGYTGPSFTTPNKRLRMAPKRTTRRASSGEMAGGPVPRRVLDEFGIDLGADLLRLPAARMEPAARRRIHWARHVAGEDDPAAFDFDLWVRDRHRRKQRLRVRVERSL